MRTPRAIVCVFLLAAPAFGAAPVVVVNGPPVDATGVGATASLELTATDADGTAVTVEFFGRKTAPAQPGPDFVLGTLPDTQFYSQNSGGTRAEIFHAQTQWYVNQRAALNLAFISHMGDFVQSGNNAPAEWIIADTAMDRIEDRLALSLAYGIPWGGAPGNHDTANASGTGWGDPNGSAAMFNQNFGVARFLGRNYYGGNYGANNNNNYQLFRASGLDFIVIHLTYRTATVTAGEQAALDWADALLKAHPDRRAIVTSHWIIGTGNPAPFEGPGQRIYNNLRDNPNLLLLLCGHVHGEGRRVDVFEGRTVHTVLQDYQGEANGGNGWLRYFIFSPANNTISARTYSPTLDQSRTDAATQFTLAANLQGAVMDWVSLDTVPVNAGVGSATLEWTGLETGSRYEWYATANDGTTTTTTPVRRFSTVEAADPVVALSAPAPGASFSAGSTIPLAASASDADGVITHVEFYVGNVKLGEDATPPYEASWAGATPGEYVLAAVARDNSQRATLSDLVDIIVGNELPIVALTSPLGGATYDALAMIILEALATDGDGMVTAVEFFANGVKIGEDLAAPFAFDWSGVPSGSYALTARATDNFGSIVTSGTVPVTVTNAVNAAPAIVLTTPVAGSIVIAGAPLALTATASDADGIVQLVEFFDGANKLGEDGTAPFTWTWPAVPLGGHTLSARARDNDGGVTTSLVVAISAVAPPPPTFSYSQNFNSMGSSGQNPPAGWSIRNAVGSATTWSTSVPAANVAGMVTVAGTLLASNSPTAGNIRGYNSSVSGSTSDRVLSTCPTGNAGSAIQLQLSNTSGGPLVTLNLGYVIYRDNASSGANELPGFWLFYSLDGGATWTNVAALNPVLSGTSGVVVPNTVGATTVPSTLIYLPSPWNAGATLLFRWVDDNANSFTDQVIGLNNVTLTGSGPVTGNTPPAVVLTAPANNAVFTAPINLTLTATASDLDGSVARVEFFQGATKLGEDLNAPYTFSWLNVPLGSHLLTARATDNTNATTTSSVATLTIQPPPNLAPAVALTFPANNASFTAPANLTLTATANDTDGVVTRVEFFAGDTELGEDTLAPFEFTWTNVPVGAFVLTARAVDDDGATTPSAAVSIVVNGAVNLAPVVTLTAPGAGADFVAPAAITLAANATDADGTVARVEYFQGATKLGETTSLPHEFLWENVPAGAYLLTARATDAAGATTTSAPVAITVAANPAADTDGDGIPDTYESAYGLDPGNPNDADLDRDGDLHSNRLEYALGTAANVGNRTGLPTVALGVGADAGRLLFSFNRLRSTLTYVVQASDDLKTFTNLATNPGDVGTLVTVIDPNTTSAKRYLRLSITDGVSTVATTPLGRVRLSFPQNQQITFNLPLHEVVGAIGGRPAGFITAVGASTLDSTGAGWSAGQLSQAATPYFVRITSGAARGRTFQISSATAHTATRLTVINGGTNLTALGIVPGTDTFEIIPGDTLAGLFPPGLISAGTFATGDMLGRWTGTAVANYYFDGANWRTQAGAIANTVVLRFDDGWFMVRRGPTTNWTLLGQAPATDAAAVVVRGGYSVVSLLPVEQTFGEFALQTRLPAWTSNPANPAAGDHVQLTDGAGGATVNYFDGTRWRRQGGVDVTDVLLLQAGRPMIIVRPTGTGSTVLTQAKTY